MSLGMTQRIEHNLWKWWWCWCRQ